MSTDSPADAPIVAARLLARSARAGTLCTVIDGQPFASWVTPAPAPDGSLLLLLSGLSEHTRHLAKEPRVSMLLTAPQLEANPQANARLTLTGVAEACGDERLKSRWIARHPYAAFYAGFADFALWRVVASAGLYIGGFASASRLRRADVTPNPVVVQAIAEAEEEIMAHCNGDHAETLEMLAHLHGGQGPGWRMTMCDIDGCDLSLDEQVIRVAWFDQASSVVDVRSQLVRLARAAREHAASTALRG